MESLNTDPRYASVAICAAQHLRAVACRLEARGPSARPMAFDVLHWRRREWSDFLPPISPSTRSMFAELSGVSFPGDRDELGLWLRGERKQILRHAAAGRLRLLATTVEESWNLKEQPARWRKRATSWFNGYAYNLAHMVLRDAQATIPERHQTLHFDFLSTSSLPPIRRWLEARKVLDGLTFVLAEAQLSSVCSTPWRRLVEVSLETENGLHVTDRFEGFPGTGVQGDHVRPVRLPRVHRLIGHV